MNGRTERRGGALRLVGDVGGTNARFALVGEDGIATRIAVMRAADHPGLVQAAEAYLAGTDMIGRPAEAAFAVASPVTGDRIDFTNSDWSFSIAALKKQLVLERLVVVNDFVAVALAVPLLAEDQRVAIGPPDGGPSPADRQTPIAVLGPGTGLGVAALVPEDHGWRAVATEGGHATLAAVGAREAAVIERMRAATRTGHVSAERALSGPGLVHLATAIAELDGGARPTLQPGDITARAVAGDEFCRMVLDMFCAMLGGFAGNLALSFGARRGVYIAGGIVPDVIDYLAGSAFRERFESKGRFREYLQAVPTYVVTHPQPAFLGLAALLGRPG